MEFKKGAPPPPEAKEKLPNTWPRMRGSKGENDELRPTVSFLFSGGVFRGVFQVGVINALNEAGLRPDLIAGASIGTITSAMVGSVYKHREEGKAEEEEELSRRIQGAKVAATFLAIDRLVLTDRFSNFIRRFTLRAADAHFSLRDADLLFRRFDRGHSDTFGKKARRVAAGLERLFQVDPFELARSSGRRGRRSSSRHVPKPGRT